MKTKNIAQKTAGGRFKGCTCMLLWKMPVNISIMTSSLVYNGVRRASGSSCKNLELTFSTNPFYSTSLLWLHYMLICLQNQKVRETWRLCYWGLLPWLHLHLRDLQWCPMPAWGHFRHEVWAAIHPAHLRVTRGDVTREFTSPSQAAEFVKTLK